MEKKVISTGLFVDPTIFLMETVFSKLVAGFIAENSKMVLLLMEEE